MKITAFLLCFVLSLTGCSLKFYPLKGTYPPTPIVYYSDRPFDKVWDNIIDLFSQKGISIKIIDRSSGLIISDQRTLTGTYENKSGVLYDPAALVVVEHSNMDSEDGRKTPRFVISGGWNIRIKTENNKTSININIVNIDAYQTTYNQQQKFDPHARTTGVFEKAIFDAIK